MQFFKENDELEKKVFDISEPLLSQLQLERVDFFDDAYTSYPLGDVLYELNRSPLAHDIPLDIFRTSYFAIHNLFTRPGTFEFYIEVFKAIFGDAVEIEFIIPANGCLNINIRVMDTEEDFLMYRNIVNGAYVYDELLDSDENNLMAQVKKGPKTDSEIEAIINEIKSHGVFTVASLVI